MNSLISINDLSDSQIDEIFTKAKYFKENTKFNSTFDYLEGVPLCLGFLEPSTRTKFSFELAAKRLNTLTLDFDSQSSSQLKGESLLDTIRTFESMNIRMYIIRHSENDILNYLSSNSNSIFINAGTGTKYHPSQALLDAFTLRERLGELENKNITIVGDIRHSRVAGSNIDLLSRLGMNVSVCAPDKLIMSGIDRKVNIEEAISDSDAIMMLRIQKERMENGLIESIGDYKNKYALTEQKLSKKKELIVMHPGPVNYGVELEASIYDYQNCTISDQVENGVYIRMAILSIFGRELA